MAREVSCKFCGRTGPAAQAHIIPKGFFRHLVDNEKRVMLSVPLHDFERTRSFQTSPFDHKILCQRCESEYAHLDTYGIGVFRDGKYTFVREQGVERFFYMRDVEVSRLRRFVLFTLWKIAATNNYSCRSVTLDQDLDSIRDLVRDGKCANATPYPILLTYYFGAVRSYFDGVPVDLHSFDVPFSPVGAPDTLGKPSVIFEFGSFEVTVALDDVANNSPWNLMSVGVFDCPLVYGVPFATSDKWKQIQQGLRSVQDRR